MDSLLEVMRLKTICTKLIFSKSKYILRLIYFVDRKEHAIPLFVNAKIMPVTFLYYEAVCKLMLDVHNDSAPSNIMKRLTRTSNIRSIPILLAHQRHNSLALSTLGLKCKERPFRVLVSKSGIRYLMNIKICQRNP